MGFRQRWEHFYKIKMGTHTESAVSVDVVLEVRVAIDGNVGVSLRS